MNNDNNLIFESYMDNLSKTKKELGSNIMRMVKYGMPDESKIPELKERLISIFTDVKKAGGHVTPQQSEEAKQLVNQLRNSGLPEEELRNLYRQAPTEDCEGYSAKDYADEMERKGVGQKISGEEAENGLAQGMCVEDLAAKHGVSLEEIQHQLEMGIKVETEHTQDIEEAKKIAMDHLFEDPNYYSKLSKMEKSQDDEMPTKQFMSLKQFINKGPIKIKKPTKELPSTNSKIHDLAKQDPREGQREENAEKYIYDNIEVAFNLNGREYIAYGDVHFGQEDLHGKDEDTVENFSVIDAQTKQEVQDDAVLRHGYNAVYNAGVNQSAEENAEGNLSYNPSEHLVKAAHAIREILLKNADDEARTEHIIQMAHIILGSKNDHDPREYNKILEGLIILLNRFIVVQMNENEERRLDPKCWKGYHKSGTKLKGGVRVNNCVKNS